MKDPSPEHWKAAYEGLLENESLTAGLDDEAAQALLDWGIANLRRILAAHAELPAEKFEEATYTPQRLNRKLMRQVSRWTARRGELSPQENAAQLRQALELADGLHPDRPPRAPESGTDPLAFSQQAAVEFIRALRVFIDPA